MTLRLRRPAGNPLPAGFAEKPCPECGAPVALPESLSGDFRCRACLRIKTLAAARVAVAVTVRLLTGEKPYDLLSDDERDGLRRMVADALFARPPEGTGEDNLPPKGWEEVEAGGGWEPAPGQREEIEDAERFDGMS